MIVTEFYGTRPDGVNLFHTYSDAGKTIRQDQTGAEYDEAVDIENSGYTYTETENQTYDELTATEALNLLLGRDADEPGEDTDAP